jgi:hypothetical protein
MHLRKSVATQHKPKELLSSLHWQSLTRQSCNNPQLFKSITYHPTFTSLLSYKHKNIEIMKAITTKSARLTTLGRSTTRSMASGKEIRFGVQGRAAMLRGVDLLADAVQVCSSLCFFVYCCCFVCCVVSTVAVDVGVAAVCLDV